MATYHNMLISELFHWNFSLYILCNEDSVLWYKVNSHQWFVPSQFPCHGSTYSLLGKTLQNGYLMTIPHFFLFFNPSLKVVLSFFEKFFFGIFNGENTLFTKSAQKITIPHFYFVF